MNGISHHRIREAIRERIAAGEWALGERIPGEAALAEEYGCARTTVNRALRTLAEEGIVERKRKGGTRIRPLPLPQAQLKIPIIREQVEAGGARYDHAILARERESQPPAEIATRMRLPGANRLAFCETLHRADNQPFAFERRWVNPRVVPGFADADLTALSANEWLVRTVPLTTGEVALSASAAEPAIAEALATNPGTALFTMQRTTWLDDQPVTSIDLYYRPGYRLDFTI